MNESIPMIEVISPEVETYLQQVVIPIRLACHSLSGWPTIVSLWYLYDDGRLYCATRRDARVVNYLENDSRCGFEIAADQPPYCGVRGQGRAVIQTGDDLAMLKRLIKRYIGTTDDKLAQRLLARDPAEEVTIAITPYQLFTWNYSKRMSNGADDKPCP